VIQNITEVLIDLSSGLEAKTDFTSESEIQLELLRELHTDSNARIQWP
jgi:hypothetical protein